MIWTFSRIYGLSKLSSKHLLCEYIVNTSNGMHQAWLLIGDFNQVLYNEDKLSSFSTLKGVKEF